MINKLAENAGFFRAATEHLRLEERGDIVCVRPLQGNCVACNTVEEMKRLREELVKISKQRT